MSSWPSKNEEVGCFVNYEKCCQSAAALSSSGRRLLSRLMLVWSELVIKYSAISDRHTHKHCSGYLTLHNRAMQVILLPRKKQKELSTWCRTSSTASRSRWPRLPAAPRCCRRWRRRRAGTWTVDTVVSEEHSLKTEAPQRVNVTPVDARCWWHSWALIGIVTRHWGSALVLVLQRVRRRSRTRTTFYLKLPCRENKRSN